MKLDSSNGAIKGSYSTNEAKSEAKSSDGSTVTLGYISCMGKTDYFAQMKKTSGKLYNLTALPKINSITVTFETADVLKLATYNSGETPGEGKEITSGQPVSVSEKEHFLLATGSNVVYVKSIEICYGGKGGGQKEDSSVEESSLESTSEEKESSSNSSTSEASSTYSGGYYDRISATSTGAALKNALYNLIKDHNNRGYDFAYEAYKTSDVDENGKIIDMYSAYHWDPEKDHQGAAGKGNYSKEGDLFNREHTVPQSVFKEASPMKADLHHLLPTDGYVNGKRSNYPHAEVEVTKYISTNGCKLGTSATSGYSGTAFEVIDEYKGDIARIYFYMATRYENVLPGWGSFAVFTKDTYPSLSPWAKTLYLKWSDQDPVSEKEIKRNEAIYGYQGNRNPFVDHPEYAHRIWG